MRDSVGKDFFRFAAGFIGMLSLGFVLLLGIGFYQIEIAGTKNLSAAEVKVDSLVREP